MTSSLQVNVACTEDDIVPYRPLVVGAYADARARGWPFLSDVLQARLRGASEDAAAIVAAAVHALARYDRLLAFATDSEGRSADEEARTSMLFTLARPDSAETRRVEERLARVESRTEQLGIRYSLPDWLVDEVRDESLLARMNETPPRVARVNTLKTTREACLTALLEEGVEARPAEHAAQGIVFSGRRHVPGSTGAWAKRGVSPFRTKAFARGDFEMQDEASQLVADLVAPPPKSCVVDACAGAGGKTLALAAALAGKGKVIAFDASKAKVTELRRRARRAGASNVEARIVDLPGALIELDAPVARVLVDAPCTGVGAMRRNPEARWRLRPEDLPRLRKAQAALLRAAAELVGENGRLVYSVCSFLPVEGERIVEEFLDELGGFVLMTARDVMGRARTEAIATPDGKYLRTWQEGDRTRGGSMDGFFAAVMRRSAKR
jgi:16S rRNA (cytosine967-C5)-methyltransferase